MLTELPREVGRAEGQLTRPRRLRRLTHSTDWAHLVAAGVQAKKRQRFHVGVKVNSNRPVWLALALGVVAHQ